MAWRTIANDHVKLVTICSSYWRSVTEVCRKYDSFVATAVSLFTGGLGESRFRQLDLSRCSPRCKRGTLNYMKHLPIVILSLFLAACEGGTVDADAAGIAQLNTSQRDAIMRSVESVINAYPAAPPSLSGELAVEANHWAIQIALWRGGVRLGRGYAIATTTLEEAAVVATSNAMRNLKDKRRLRPRLSVVNLTDRHKPRAEQLGIEAFGVLLDDQLLELLPPSLPLEEGRDFNQLLRKLETQRQRLDPERAQLFSAPALQLARDANGVVQTVVGTALDSATDLFGTGPLVEVIEQVRAEHLSSMAMWLNENREGVDGYMANYQTLTGTLDVTTDMLALSQVALASGTLRRLDLVSYFQLQEDLIRLNRYIQTAFESKSTPNCTSASCEDNRKRRWASTALLALLGNEFSPEYHSTATLLAEYLDQSAYRYPLSPFERCVLDGRRLSNSALAESCTVNSSFTYQAHEKRALALVGAWPWQYASQPALIDTHLSTTELAEGLLSSASSAEALAAMLVRHIRYEDAYMCGDAFRCVGGVRDYPLTTAPTLEAWLALLSVILATPNA